MEAVGIEPTTVCLQGRCSPLELHPHTDNRIMLIGNFGKYALRLAAVLRLAARAAYQPGAREHHRKQLVA